MQKTGHNYRIGAIIVNYKTARMTLDCVESLVAQLAFPDDHVVVVDNCSGSMDAEVLRTSVLAGDLSSRVSVLALDSNDGFSAGNNAGIRSMEADYYLLTNSDTLFRPGAVAELLGAAAARPEAGIISPRLEWENGEAQVSCFRFMAPQSEMVRSADTGFVSTALKRFVVPLPPVPDPTNPPWTSFACALVRNEAFERIGVLDEGYFMYFEDADFCRRVRKGGLEILNWPRARVVHLQGRSSDVEDRVRAMRKLPDFYYHSRSRYYRKFYGYFGYFAANILWMIGRCASASRQLIGNKGRPVPEAEFLNIWKARETRIRKR